MGNISSGHLWYTNFWVLDPPLKHPLLIQAWGRASPFCCRGAASHLAHGHGILNSHAPQYRIFLPLWPSPFIIAPGIGCSTSMGRSSLFGI